MIVLVVEDDVKLADSYAQVLKGLFQVLVAHTIEEAKIVADKYKPDVILLDMMLPDGKGVDLITQIKPYLSPVIIIISALENEAARKQAYESGADDYMIKPITLFELEYKLKAISKRKHQEKRILKVGDVILDMETNELATSLEGVYIQPNQIFLLKLLILKYENNEILEIEELLTQEKVNFSNKTLIHTIVSRLRKNIEEIGSESVFIESVYGKGYRLVVLQ